MKGYIRRGITWFTVIAMTLTVLPARIVAGTLDETLDFTSATQNVSGDGYIWDNEAKTLKLEDLTLNVASGDGIILPDGAALTLSGNNKITTQAGSLIRANGNLTIDGGGTLEGKSLGKNDDYHGIQTGGGDLEIGNCTLDLQIKPEFISEVITTAEYENGKAQDKGGVLLLKAGANVTVGEEDQRSWGVCTGRTGYKNKACGDLTIEKGAVLTATGLIGIHVGAGSNVTISGTLDTTGCDPTGISANVLTYSDVKIDGVVKMAPEQYMDTRGENLTINAAEGSGGSIFNPDMLAVWIYSDKRGFEKSLETYFNRRYSMKKIYVAKGATFTIIPTGEIKGTDTWGEEVIVDQTLKLAPEKLSDLSGGGYIKVEDGAVVELTLEGADKEQVQAQKLFCGKVVLNGTEETMHACGTEATCQEKAVCAVCHEKYGSVKPDNHVEKAQWVKNKEGHTKEYKCCGATVVPQEAHTWKDGACSECGYQCEHAGGTATCHTKAVCITCGEEYGETDPGRHEDLVHVDAKDSTKDAQGNTEYWHCDDCDKYYSDAAGKTEIRKEDMVVPVKSNSGTENGSGSQGANQGSQGTSTGSETSAGTGTQGTADGTGTRDLQISVKTNTKTNANAGQKADSAKKKTTKTKKTKTAKTTNNTKTTKTKSSDSPDTGDGQSPAAGIFLLAVSGSILAAGITKRVTIKKHI